MFIIPEELAEKLERTAARRNQTVIEMLEIFADGVNEIPNPMLKFAELMEQANIEFTQDDIADHSRELLERDFANDILTRYRPEG